MQIQSSKIETNLLLAARTILGGILLIVGLNEFHGLLGMPDVNEQGAHFLGALRETGYLYDMVKAVEIICGLLLVSGLFVPLANLVLFPVLVNILMFHIFIAPQGLFVALLIILCSAYIFYYYRKLFAFLVMYNSKLDPNSFREDDIRPYNGKHAT